MPETENKETQNNVALIISVALVVMGALQIVFVVCNVDYDLTQYIIALITALLTYFGGGKLFD